MVFINIIHVVVIATLIWLTHYLDRRNEIALASVSFVGLIIYTLIVAAFMSF